MNNFDYKQKMVVLLYTLSTKQKVGECYQGTEYSSDNIAIIFKKKSTGIIILSYLILIVVTNFFVESLNHYELLEYQ